MPASVGTDGERMDQQDDGVEQVEVKAKVKQGPETLRLNLHLSLVLVLIWLGFQLPQMDMNAWAEPTVSPPAGKPKGNILRGRDLFNGKGACYYCHGIDGYLNHPPRLESDTAKLIAKLNPPPPDLRKPEVLRLKNNQERSRAIREGHPGTGMFPDTTLTDQDLADTLLYLALIRKDPHPEQ